MIIPKNELKMWASLKERGDITEMVNKSIKLNKYISRQAIARTIERGRGTPEAYLIIKGFYSKKAEQLAK